MRPERTPQVSDQGVWWHRLCQIHVIRALYTPDSGKITDHFADVQYIQKQPVNFVNIHEKNSIINFKKVLPNRAFSYILIHVVTLIAMKREVATHMRGFSVERMSS